MEEESEESKNQQINIELSEDIASGEYSNLVMIAHSNSEFIFDFIRLMPGVPKAKVKSRIIMTPDNAKKLLQALQENIENYEASFGKIKNDREPPTYPMNFGATVGEA